MIERAPRPSGADNNHVAQGRDMHGERRKAATSARVIAGGLPEY
jgi:hypothetical protein